MYIPVELRISVGIREEEMLAIGVLVEIVEVVKVAAAYAKQLNKCMCNLKKTINFLNTDKSHACFSNICLLLVLQMHLLAIYIYNPQFTPELAMCIVVLTVFYSLAIYTFSLKQDR